MELLNTIDQLKSELDSLRPISKAQEAAIMQKFRLDWNYHSNHLEGNSLSYGETKALILFGITANGKPLKDHFEMTGHDEAIKWIEEVVKQERPLTENFIRELHTLILKQPYWVNAITPDGKPTRKKVHVGQYKIEPNHVLTRTGEIFRFASPEETPAKMKDLVEWYQKRTEDGATHPFLLAMEFHYRFIRIHPFDDGNGRTARILMNFILMQHGYPPVIIKTEDKEDYFAALQQADAGILEAFAQYIGENLVYSLELMIRGAKGESLEEPDDLDKEIALIEQKLKGLDQNTIVKKNLDVILERYDKSFSKLFEEFIRAGEKFENLYHDQHVNIFFDGSNQSASKKEVISKNKVFLEKEIKFVDNMYIQYGYFKIKNNVLKGFSYYSRIDILFENEGYSVFDQNKKIEYKKKYNQDLTDEEIKTLVNVEIKCHTQFIKEQIAKYEKGE